MIDLPATEDQLDAFETTTRHRALEALVAATDAGEVELPPHGKDVNLHAHSFYSYNAYGYSPARLAWEARKRGLGMIGTVDFDTLDAMEEIYEAADALDLPASAGIETRVFVPAYAQKEINSPGEPGAAYFMGAGFVRAPQTEAGRAILADMIQRAEERNRAMLQRLNEHIDYVQVDYDADVLPLTPAGNATERHMLIAFERKSAEVFAGRDDDAASFWAGKLGIDRPAAVQLIQNGAFFRDTFRSRLMKRGGVGYVAPDETTFPPIEDAVEMIRSAGAIPTIAWLDGTTDGEADAAQLVDDFVGFGCEALNIVPDRNWCITQPVEKERKLGKLHEMVRACRERSLPIFVGTEMNKPGQTFVDDFDAPELAEVVDAFYAGGAFLYGHVLLARTLGCGRMSEWAKAHFADRSEAVDYYTRVGRAAPAPRDALKAIAQMPPDSAPETFLGALL
jgi:hypothetical protein